MNLDEKLQVAHQLARLGVDVIEAGYPAASPGDADSVRAVAEEVGVANGPTICGLARATEHDVRTCAASVAPAARTGSTSSSRRRTSICSTSCAARATR
jgi:2-isopropylmalate synthase